MQPNEAWVEAEELIPDLQCACATLRRAARAVSQLYADEFHGLLEGTQFSLLALLNKQPGTNQSTLGQILMLDKTTLSRNLNLMKRKGWVEPAPVDDKRERGFQLSASGSELLEKAKPAWLRAQARLQSAMGDEEWTRMFGVANSVTKTAARIHGDSAN